MIARGDVANLLGFRFAMGDLIMLVATVLWSFYTWMLRRQRPPLPMTAFLAVQIGLGALMILPLYLIELAFTQRIPEATATNVAALVYVAVLPSIVAYYCWDRGVAHAGAVLPMYFVNLTPVFTALLATFFLAEPIGLYHFVGGALILVGIHLANRPTRLIRQARDTRRRAGARWLQCRVPPTHPCPGEGQSMPMRNDQVVTVRRTDYRPPAFLLDRVVLEFDLDPASTRVASTLEVRRNHALPGNAGPLVLDGEDLELETVEVDGTALARSGYELIDGGAAHPGAVRSLHRPDRQPHPSGGEHRADGPVRVERQLLQPVRGRGLPPHHLLPGSARRDGARTA